MPSAQNSSPAVPAAGGSPPPLPTGKGGGASMRANGNKVVVPIPGPIRRFVATRPVATDVIIALVAGILGLASGFSQMDRLVFVPSSTWPWYVLWALAYGSLLFRRKAPAAVTIITLAALLAQSAFHDFTPPWALLISLYTVAAQRGSRWGWACSAGVAGVLTVAFFASPLNVETPAVAAFGIMIVTLIGLNVRGRRLYLTALVDRAAQLQREKAQEVRFATSAERARIARELHDVVAHGMSVMISLSDGAEAVADLDPVRSREAVRQIGAVGRESLGDMRRLLGVLHDGQETAALAPQPGLDDVDDLVATYRSAGLPVTLTRSGSMPTAAAVQVVLYRAIQEGLTNALRYADRPTRVSVVLRGWGSEPSVRSGKGVSVEVTDDGRGTAPMVSVGTERGLVGLRERAALFDGTISAGPRPELGGRGWRVQLTLPKLEAGTSQKDDVRPATESTAEEAP